MNGFMWQDGVRQKKVNSVRCANNFFRVICVDMVNVFLADSSYRLLKAVIPYENITRCQQVYNSINVRDDHICAGGSNGIDSCSGDSGNNYENQL